MSRQVEKRGDGKRGMQPWLMMRVGGLGRILRLRHVANRCLLGAAGVRILVLLCVFVSTPAALWRARAVAT